MIDNPSGAIAVYLMVSCGVTLLSFVFFTLFFRVRRYRLIKRTAISKIKDAKPGWVALSGIARARHMTRDPILDRPCYWWRCVVQEYDGDTGDWYDTRYMVTTESFHLDDETGSVVVDPHYAEHRVEDVMEEALQLTSENYNWLAPLLSSWGFKLLGGKISFLINRAGRKIGLSFDLIMDMRLKVQTLQWAAPMLVVGHLSRGVLKPHHIFIATTPRLELFRRTANDERVGFVFACVVGTGMTVFGVAFARWLWPSSPLAPALIDTSVITGLIIGYRASGFMLSSRIAG